MKLRKRLVGAVLATGLAAGCSGEAVPSHEETTSAPLSSQSYVTQLSPELVAATKAVVAIRGEKEGSGVKVADRTILTAGHVAKLALGPQCNGLEVDAKLSASEAVAVPVKTSKGVHEEEKSEFTRNDLGLITLQASGVDRLPTVHIAEQTPSIGSILYFANWEPAGPENATRNPFYGPVKTPAIFSGKFVARTSGNTMIITPDGNAYDETGHAVSGDATHKEGASGGAVFVADGKLLGISSAGTTKSSLDEYPGQKRELKEIIDPLPMPNGLAVAQIVDPSTVSQLLNTQRFC